VELEIVGAITDISVIATGGSIREIARLRKVYGRGRWRKLKGIATVRLPDDTLARAEYTGMKHTVSEEKNSRSSVSFARTKSP
jgi:hypothetical protein